MKNPLRSSDEVSWAATLAPRLRALQASFADDPAPDRQGYIEEEIQQALEKIPASRRAAHLEALTEYFPVWGEGTLAPVRPAAQTARPKETVIDVADRLCAMAAQLPPAELSELTSRLAAYGLAAPAAGPTGEETLLLPEPQPATVELPPELQKRLGIRPDQNLDLERVLRLIAALAEFAVTIEQPAWSIWKSLAPQSTVRRDPNSELRKLAGPYLVGDREVSSTQISQTLEKTRHLIAALLASIGTTGETFARQFLSRFSPESIKAAADAESGFFLGPEQKCWRQYVGLFNELSGVAVEQEISRIIAQGTETLMTGQPGAT